MLFRSCGFIVLVSTFLSMSEVAILTINPVKLKQLSSKKKHLNFFIKKKSSAASDIMVSNWLFDFSSAMLLSSMIADLFPESPKQAFVASSLSALVTLYIATLAAKLYSANHAEAVITKLGRLIIAVYWIQRPLVAIVSAPALFFLRNLLKSDGGSQLSNGELLGVLAMAKKEGVIEARQHTLIRHLMTLQTETVKSILPLHQVIESVDIESNVLSLKQKLFEKGHKRIIVTKEFKGKQYPVGILLLRDIVRVNVEHLTKLVDNELDETPPPSIASLMRPCVVTQEDANAMVLIEKLDKDDHIVVAVNAEGEVTGVLQSDDIIRILIQDKTTREERDGLLGIKMASKQSRSNTFNPNQETAFS